jgi:hypothetical protein
MKRCISAVYAISIGRATPPEGKEFTDADAQRLAATIPPLIEEVNRQDALLNDPWIEAYIKAKARSSFVPSLSERIDE